jgi:hypothetical protein
LIGDILTIELFRQEKSPGMKANITEVQAMKSEYDFSTMKSRKNPYAAKLKRPVTMRLSEDVIGYFKQMADEAGVPFDGMLELNIPLKFARDFCICYLFLCFAGTQHTPCGLSDVSCIVKFILIS